MVELEWRVSLTGALGSANLADEDVMRQAWERVRVMHKRSLTISILLVVFMVIGAGVVHASGGNGQRSVDTKSSKDDSGESKQDKAPKGDKTIRLFGQQEPDEASLITPDGRVFTGTEPLPEGLEPSPGDVQVFRERPFKLDKIEGTPLSNSIYTIRLLHLDDGRRR